MTTLDVDSDGTRPGSATPGAAATAAVSTASSAPAAVMAPDEPTDDARVAAVLAVLRGAPLDTVARQWSIDHTLLQRWVRGFVDAGTAVVVNRPDPDAAAHRDRFLAAFSWEFRQPLGTAIGYAAQVASAAKPTTALAEASGRLETALHRLTQRLDDVELLVSAALGGLQVRRDRVSVASLVGDLDGLDLRTIRGKGAAFEMEVDPALFGRVLHDLWEAAALDPAPRTRQLYVSVIGPWAEIRILREADPIGTAVLQALFEPFDADFRDTGVTTGLYLSRALTVAHGGTVGVDQDDSGAAFWVRVPHTPARRRPSQESGPARST